MRRCTPHVIDDFPSIKSRKRFSIEKGFSGLIRGLSMSPGVVLARAKRRILLPFAVSLNAISIAALVWLDVQKSLALKYNGESLDTPSRGRSDQDPAFNKVAAKSERDDGTKFRDKVLTNANANSAPTPTA